MSQSWGKAAKNLRSCCYSSTPLAYRVAGNLWSSGRRRSRRRGRCTGSLGHQVTIKKICEERPPARYDLKVIAICQQPMLAMGEPIIVASTLIERTPFHM